MEWSAKRVARWLANEVKLPKYVPLFLQRDIRLTSLLGLAEEDLEIIGVHDVRESKISHRSPSLECASISRSDRSRSSQKNDQRQIQNAILQLWGRVDAGQSLEDGDDDDDDDDDDDTVEATPTGTRASLS